MLGYRTCSLDCYRFHCTRCRQLSFRTRAVEYHHNLEKKNEVHSAARLIRQQRRLQTMRTWEHQPRTEQQSTTDSLHRRGAPLQSRQAAEYRTRGVGRRFKIGYFREITLASRLCRAGRAGCMMGDLLWRAGVYFVHSHFVHSQAHH